MIVLAHFPADGVSPEGFDLIRLDGCSGPDVGATALVADPESALVELGIMTGRLIEIEEPAKLLGFTWHDPYDAALLVEFEAPRIA